MQMLIGLGDNIKSFFISIREQNVMNFWMDFICAGLAARWRACGETKSSAG